MKDGNISGLQIWNVCIQLFIHMLEDAAIFEGKVAYPLYVLNLSLFENFVVNTQRLKKNDSLPIEKASFVFIPI